MNARPSPDTDRTPPTLNEDRGLHLGECQQVAVRLLDNHARSTKTEACTSVNDAGSWSRVAGCGALNEDRGLHLGECAGMKPATRHVGTRSTKTEACTSVNVAEFGPAFGGRCRTLNEDRGLHLGE